MFVLPLFTFLSMSRIIDQTHLTEIVRAKVVMVPSGLQLLVYPLPSG